MNAFAILFILLISVVGVFSETAEGGFPATGSFSPGVLKLANRLEENLNQIKSTECRFDELVPKNFKDNCADFLSEFEHGYKNCFCHKKKVSLCVR